MIESYVRQEARAMRIQPRQLSALIWSGVRIDQSGDANTHYASSRLCRHRRITVLTMSEKIAIEALGVLILCSAYLWESNDDRLGENEQDKKRDVYIRIAISFISAVITSLLTRSHTVLSSWVLAGAIHFFCFDYTVAAVLVSKKIIVGDPMNHKLRIVLGILILLLGLPFALTAAILRFIIRSFATGWVAVDEIADEIFN